MLSVRWLRVLKLKSHIASNADNKNTLPIFGDSVICKII